jgi:dethiobiotin synthetase
LGTGTDTGIAKAVLSAGLADLLGANYWKPIQAGLEGETDAELVARLGSLLADRTVPERYRLRTPASPIIPSKLAELASTRLRRSHLEARDRRTFGVSVFGSKGVSFFLPLTVFSRVS